MKLIRKEDLKEKFEELTQEQGLSVDEAINELHRRINSNGELLLGFNGIYVYMGTYKIVHKSSTSHYPVKEVLVSEEDPTAKYKLYYEIDTGLPKYVNIKDELKDFEENNVIIYIPNPRNFESRITFEEDYKKLSKLYLKHLCLEGEEAAIAKVTNEEYIKQIFSLENYMKEYNISSAFHQAFSDAALCNKIEKNNSHETCVTGKKKVYTKK